MTPSTHFLLNDQPITTTEPRGMLVLDYLRRRARQTGTKEGCKEGDCGACAVLVGVLDGERVTYEPVTSCLMPLGELEGKHLVTIEGLNVATLSPVQQAIVDQGATQCGFCTPGIVVSLTGLLMQDDLDLDQDAVKRGLSGHLCRCTGYRSLKACGEILRKTLGEHTPGVETLIDRGVLPEAFRDVVAKLRALPANGAPAGERPEHFIAGGTDLYVQRGPELPEVPVEILNLRPELRGIERQNGHLRVGAATSFEEFAADPLVRAMIPKIDDYMFLIASWQIRNRATLGGNLVNASPIGDMTALLLALGADVVLVAGDETRTVPLKDFYRGYKILDRKPGEVLTEILIPVRPAGTRVGWEKVSKRKCLDIASVNAAMRLRLDGDTIADCALAVGGVAPIPLLLRATGESLLGKPLDAAAVRAALDVAQSEISPISDVRGSAGYKRLLTRQLLIALFHDACPDRFDLEELDETP